MMIRNVRSSGRNSLGWLLGFMVLVLAACVQVTEPGERRLARELVFPSPPDEPRFVYERTIHGSADVEPELSSGALQRLLTGDQPRTSIGMRKPYGVAVHEGRIFVSDTASNEIKVFDVPEGRSFSFGQDEASTDDRLKKAIGISADEAGNLFVADASSKFIMAYSRDGRLLRKIGGAKFFDRLASLKVDKKGERVYAVDIGGVSSEHHRVRVFNAKTGQHLFDFGSRGDGPGQFNLPRDVAIGKDKLYVVDGGNFRIQIFDMQGKFIQTFGAIGKQMGNFGRPKEADTDKDGNLYVIDAAFGNFQIFNADGQLLMFVGERADRDKPAGFGLPSGIAVDEDGRVYVVDQLFKKVDIFRPYKLGAGNGYLGKKAAAQ